MKMSEQFYTLRLLLQKSKERYFQEFPNWFVPPLIVSIVPIQHIYHPLPGRTGSTGKGTRRIKVTWPRRLPKHAT